MVLMMMMMMATTTMMLRGKDDRSAAEPTARKSTYTHGVSVCPPLFLLIHLLLFICFS